MKFNYKLQRLCGSSYGCSDGSTGGNIVYNSNGTILLSPVSNRIQVINVLTHTTQTLPIEARSNIKLLAISPDNRLLLTVDTENHVLLINFHRQVVLHRFAFKHNACVLQFSPCGLYFAIGSGKTIQTWHTPTLKRELNPFQLYQTYTGLGDSVTTIQWSSDSSLIMGSSKNGTVRVWSVHRLDKYIPLTLSGHKTSVIGAYFCYAPDNILKTIYTISSDGAMVSWSSTTAATDTDGTATEFGTDFFGGTTTTVTVDGNSTTQAQQLVNSIWKTSARHYFQQENTNVTTTAYAAVSGLLIVGFTSGIFALYELPSVNTVHTLSVSNHAISSVSINNTGEWLAFGTKNQQLLVWEWRSESYILKQQGHAANAMTCMAYSEDGVVIASGGHDGSIKLWNTSSGFCYCTLKSHTAPITSVVFSNSSVVMSSSLDGTVRAHDLHRYRNFKTYTSPTPCQFTTCAIHGGDVLVAGTLNDFSIYVWNVQSATILDVLKGHIGPLSATTFSSSGVLASASWDGTVKLWDLYKSAATPESLSHLHDVSACAFSPNGIQLCCATIGGLLCIWKVQEATLICEIDGKRDVTGGRKMNDKMTSNNGAASRYFTSVCYSADGSCVLCGGNSKFICIYNVSQRILVKKFQVSYNRNLDGILDELHSKKNYELLLLKNDNDDEADFSSNLPGARRADDGSRKSLEEVLVKQVSFSTTGREWAAVSNEGLHIYSLDDDMIFDPISLTEDITPASIFSNLSKGKYGVALLISLHLNESTLVQQVLEQTPYKSIPHIVKGIGPEQHLERLFQYISESMKDSPHVEFYLQWCLELLNTHGMHLEKHRSNFMRVLRSLSRSVQLANDGLETLCDENKYTLDFVHDQSQLNLGQQEQQ